MHKGFPNYTIGQRKGLGIALGHPMFVIAIHPEDNTVVLGTKDELQGNTLYAKEVNLMKYTQIPEGLEVMVKIRYRNEGERLRYSRKKTSASGIPRQHGFHHPGQSAVFYEGEDVVGGGIIE